MPTTTCSELPTLRSRRQPASRSEVVPDQSIDRAPASSIGGCRSTGYTHAVLACEHIFLSPISRRSNERSQFEGHLTTDNQPPRVARPPHRVDSLVLILWNPLANTGVKAMVRTLRAAIIPHRRYLYNPTIKFFTYPQLMTAMYGICPGLSCLSLGR